MLSLSRLFIVILLSCLSFRANAWRFEVSFKTPYCRSVFVPNGEGFNGHSSNWKNISKKTKLKLRMHSDISFINPLLFMVSRAFSLAMNLAHKRQSRLQENLQITVLENNMVFIFRTFEVPLLKLTEEEIAYAKKREKELAGIKSIRKMIAEYTKDLTTNLSKPGIVVSHLEGDKMVVTYAQDANFIDGDAADFYAGKNIAFELTDEAMKIGREMGQKTLNRVMNPEHNFQFYVSDSGERAIFRGNKDKLIEYDGANELIAVYERGYDPDLNE